jgi:hypothetical protein
MNVLILTPDAVGSTLLQRMLTIYMQFHQFGRPVINLHELTNGLEKYYSPEFNREIVSKKMLKEWGYYQSLADIVKLLESVDHYKTSRLAHYHIRQRGDTVAQQVPFYQYLNENFYVIACKRANVFEHALSMTLNKVTKKLNVYSAYEKIDTFYDIYQSGIELDSRAFEYQLNAYRDYINWSDQYFDVSSYFNYEQDVPRIEQFILDLPLFSNQPELVTWEKNFGITFNTWNKMHYACSDLGSVMLESNNKIDQLVLDLPESVDYYQQKSPLGWPEITKSQDINMLPATIKKQFTQDYIRQEGIFSLLPQDRQSELSFAKQGYVEAQKTINQMINLGIMISGPPIKKQTLAEKAKIVKNFDQLTEIYNHWVTNNPGVATPIAAEDVSSQVQKENQFWHKSTVDLINYQSS